VERDLQVLGVRIWRELVIDRDKWRGIVRQAKAHSGLDVGGNVARFPVRARYLISERSDRL
jgi:hypothetical protein